MQKHENRDLDKDPAEQINAASNDLHDLASQRLMPGEGFFETDIQSSVGESTKLSFFKGNGKSVLTVSAVDEEGASTFLASSSIDLLERELNGTDVVSVHIKTPEINKRIHTEDGEVFVEVPYRDENGESKHAFTESRLGPNSQDLVF